MKETIKTIVFFLLCLSFFHCASDEDCNSTNGTIVNGECIPNYVYPPVNIEEGKAYYHVKYGVITYNNGNWMNADAIIITNNELLIE